MSQENRQFVFEDLYCATEGGTAFLISVADKVPLLSVRSLSSTPAANAVCFASGFAVLSQMRRALIDCRNVLLKAERGGAPGPLLLSSAAYANSPLATLARIEKWAAGQEEKVYALRV